MSLGAASCGEERECSTAGLLAYCNAYCEDRGQCPGPQAFCDDGEWSCSCRACPLDLGVSVPPPDGGRSDADVSDASSN